MASSRLLLTKIRVIALVPAVLCFVAWILSLLCLFAGSPKGYMEDYALFTLNTSRLGSNLLNTSHHSSNPFVGYVDNVTNSVASSLNSDVNSLARELGFHDWYSVHILAVCEGYYAPGPVANATLPASKIHKSVTHCTNHTADSSHFDPQQTLQRELNASGHGNIDLSNLDWPDDITKGLDALHVAQSAVFVLYCLAIGLIFLALLLSAAGAVVLRGPMGALVNLIVDSLAFLTMLLASAIVTGIAVKAAKLINHYGHDVGVSAQQGHRFITLTWVTTLLVFVSCLAWCFDFVLARRRSQAVLESKFG